VGLSLVWRPAWPLRLHAGALSYGAGLGARAGLSLVPFKFPLTPSLTLEAGRHFPADANRVGRWVSGDPAFSSPLLSRVAYDFANAHLGLEVGSVRRFSVSLRGGLSYLRSQVDGAQAFLDAELEQEPGSLAVSTPRLRAVLPSAKLAFLLYL
jgi:hypothetical protein